MGGSHSRDAAWSRRGGRGGVGEQSVAESRWGKRDGGIAFAGAGAGAAAAPGVSSGGDGASAGAAAAGADGGSGDRMWGVGGAGGGGEEEEAAPSTALAWYLSRVASATSLADEDCCPTCLEGYTEENPRITTECAHHFHLGCIYEWMERSNLCPVCSKVGVVAVAVAVAMAHTMLSLATRGCRDLASVACPLCLPSLPALSACPLCLPSLPALSACPLCLPSLPALSACPLCLPSLFYESRIARVQCYNPALNCSFKSMTSRVSTNT
ncbi:unnamed protein product [Closterium sp. NIES-65]|nr:unnamed protein product [Closterium sp. NIES-65]